MTKCYPIFDINENKNINEKSEIIMLPSESEVKNTHVQLHMNIIDGN